MWLAAWLPSGWMRCTPSLYCVVWGISSCVCVVLVLLMPACGHFIPPLEVAGLLAKNFITLSLVMNGMLLRCPLSMAFNKDVWGGAKNVWCMYLICCCLYDRVYRLFAICCTCWFGRGNSSSACVVCLLVGKWCCCKGICHRSVMGSFSPMSIILFWKYTLHWS